MRGMKISFPDTRRALSLWFWQTTVTTYPGGTREHADGCADLRSHFAAAL